MALSLVWRWWDVLEGELAEASGRLFSTGGRASAASVSLLSRCVLKEIASAGVIWAWNPRPTSTYTHEVSGLRRLGTRRSGRAVQCTRGGSRRLRAHASLHIKVAAEVDHRLERASLLVLQHRHVILQLQALRYPLVQPVALVLHLFQLDLEPLVH